MVCLSPSFTQKILIPFFIKGKENSKGFQVFLLNKTAYQCQLDSREQALLAI